LRAGIVRIFGSLVPANYFIRRCALAVHLEARTCGTSIGSPWSFDGDEDAFKLAVEAKRIDLSFLSMSKKKKRPPTPPKRGATANLTVTVTWVPDPEANDWRLGRLG
jgi:hypothetical protein